MLGFVVLNTHFKLMFYMAFYRGHDFKGINLQELVVIHIKI